MGLLKTAIDESWKEVGLDTEAAREALVEYSRTAQRLRELWLNEQDESSRADLGRALRRHAHACKLTGSFAEALESQDECVKIWAELERDRALVLARIEAADIAHLAESDDAWQRFHELEKVVEEPRFEIYQDFYAEYRALACCREGRFLEALGLMEQALQRRAEQGRKERQLEETRTLICRIEHALSRER